MIDDAELLRRYAEGKSEAAFAELVQRRLGLVYSVALRQCGGDAHLAEDVAQKVFADLARKAAALSRRPVLSGWLCRSAQFAASDVVRAERRRRARETETFPMHETSTEPAIAADWEKLRPMLDQAMNELADEDRDALALRFFEERDFAGIGQVLKITDEAARKRVTRALDRLHAQLTRRGVTSTAAALALALANQAGVAAPAGLAASVTGAALAAPAVAGWFTIFMSMSKLQVGIAGAVAVAGATAYVVQAETNARLSREIAALHEQQQPIAALRVENQRLAAAAAEVETLRRDDAELKQLAQTVTEIKQANVERARIARVAQAQAEQDRRKLLEEQIKAKDKLAQEEVDRMNREGNALVVAYKALTAQAKDESLTTDVRAQADAAAKVKLEEIKTKQQEIKAFIEETRRKLNEMAAVLRTMPDLSPPRPQWELEKRQLEEAEARVRARRAAGQSDANTTPPANGQLSLGPRP